MSDDGTLLGLDRVATSSWLEEEAAMRAPVRFARIGQGKSNLTFLATDADGRRLVLRRPPLGDLLASAHDVERETRILRALQPTPVPTPEVLAFTDDRAVTEAPLLAVEHVEGLVVDDVPKAEALSPQTRGRLGAALIPALAAVHAVDLEGTGLVDLASHRSYAARQLKRWRRQWGASKMRELRAVEQLGDRLEAAMPEQRELTLVHGDFHLLNVIATPDGDAVRAVLDWELCTLGDPLADLGGLLAYWPEVGDEGATVFPASRLPGFPSRSQLASMYCDTTGRDISDVAFWHALGLWKVAIICEGVRRRAVDDPRNAPEGGTPSERIVEDLVTQAHEVAAAAGY